MFKADLIDCQTVLICFILQILKLILHCYFSTSTVVPKLNFPKVTQSHVKVNPSLRAGKPTLVAKRNISSKKTLGNSLSSIHLHARMCVRVCPRVCSFSAHRLGVPQYLLMRILLVLRESVKERERESRIMLAIVCERARSESNNIISYYVSNLINYLNAAT